MARSRKPNANRPEDWPVRYVREIRDGQMILALSGGTYEIRDSLRADGFRWNAEKKEWWKVADRDEAKRYLQGISNRGITVQSAYNMRANDKRHLHLVGFGRGEDFKP